MSETNGDTPRLKRIEEHIEVIFQIQRDMQQEHQLLLRAQVAQADEMQQIRKRTEEIAQRTDQRFQQTEERFRKLAEAQERMDEALTALMGTVDQIIRKMG